MLTFTLKFLTERDGIYEVENRSLKSKDFNDAIDTVIDYMHNLAVYGTYDDINDTVSMQLDGTPFKITFNWRKEQKRK